MESSPIIRAFSAPPQPAAAHACEWSAGQGGVCFAHGGSYAWQDGTRRKGLAAHLHPQEGAQGRAGQNSSGRPAKGAVLICTVVTGPFSPSNYQIAIQDHGSCHVSECRGASLPGQPVPQTRLTWTSQHASTTAASGTQQIHRRNGAT